MVIWKAAPASSCIPGENIMRDVTIIRFIKGVLRSRPPKSKYEFPWNIDLVPSYLKQLYLTENPCLELLSINNNIFIFRKRIRIGYQNIIIAQKIKQVVDVQIDS